MAVNDKQKCAIVDITATLKNQIDSYLAQGFVIQQIINLSPTQAKVLIIYATPPVIE